MLETTIDRISPDDVAARLSELGFPLKVILETIDVWLAGMKSGTPFHASSYPGTIAYHESVATLRIVGKPLGLVQDTRDGVELCVCPMTNVAVQICQGDPLTGDYAHRHLKPSTKYSRGASSRELIQAQPSLFGGPTRAPEPDAYDLWILLLRKTPEGDAVAELSSPSVVHTRRNSKAEEESTIIDWRERIFLGTVSGGETAARAPVDLSPTGDIDVPVKKRG